MVFLSNGSMYAISFDYNKLEHIFKVIYFTIRGIIPAYAHTFAFLYTTSVVASVASP
jgi:hypothetical protein